MEWWKSSVIYQVYPRSFCDSTGDGIGDLAGIIGRLDYIAWLGCDAVWLSPVYPSPMRDFGYDVSNYCDIDPRLGTLDDFDSLVREAHRRNLRVILDFVPNHTSDLHPWFIESRSSISNAKRDWYVWKDPRSDGGPPNNWLGAHGGRAWDLDPTTGQYYLHSFLSQMPDLNWDNPAVRAALYDAMRFWLARGVDGFRVDVILRIAKDPSFADEPANPEYTPDKPEYDTLLHVLTRDTDFVHPYIRELRHVVDEYSALLIGETYLPPERLVRYYGDGDECHLPFNFGLITEDLTARSIAAYIDRYVTALPPAAWPNWVLGNHDVSRVASRLGGGDAGAKLAHLLLLTLPGTTTLYYGDELGMQNGEIPPDRVVDRRALSDPERWFNRDRARTPMQWDTTHAAGFTSGDPWLPIGRNHMTHNVEVERGDPSSVLTYLRRLVEFRREHRIAEGGVRVIHVDDRVLAYTCGIEAEFVVVLNLSDRPAAIPQRLQRLRPPGDLRISSQDEQVAAPGPNPPPAGDLTSGAHTGPDAVTAAATNAAPAGNLTSGAAPGPDPPPAGGRAPAADGASDADGAPAAGAVPAHGRAENTSFTDGTLPPWGGMVLSRFTEADSSEGEACHS